jgi:hypothetical protein
MLAPSSTGCSRRPSGWNEHDHARVSVLGRLRKRTRGVGSRFDAVPILLAGAPRSVRGCFDVDVRHVAPSAVRLGAGGDLRRPHAGLRCRRRGGRGRSAPARHRARFGDEPRESDWSPLSRAASVVGHTIRGDRNGLDHLLDPRRLAHGASTSLLRARQAGCRRVRDVEPAVASHRVHPNRGLGAKKWQVSGREES